MPLGYVHPDLHDQLVEQARKEGWEEGKQILVGRVKEIEDHARKQGAADEREAIAVELDRRSRTTPSAYPIMDMLSWVEARSEQVEKKCMCECHSGTVFHAPDQRCPCYKPSESKPLFPELVVADMIDYPMSDPHAKAFKMIAHAVNECRAEIAKLRGK